MAFGGGQERASWRWPPRPSHCTLRGCELSGGPALCEVRQTCPWSHARGECSSTFSGCSFGFLHALAPPRGPPAELTDLPRDASQTPVDMILAERKAAMRYRPEMQAARFRMYSNHRWTCSWRCNQDDFGTVLRTYVTFHLAGCIPRRRLDASNGRPHVKQQ